ncbi:beta-ketoacyl-ACP synthase III [Candidatus Manganitrophus noduliformans]|uniref:Beta-ketoacyl-[acyl-carrier-protein] synthase III n=1 Tax=Candidatus Manganitrophus noduliformans TaxID=2606439 RepID=A0A7X6DNG9_9BACT|nr:beta-ketoacyl-ACP synthase III [Candidatus Manganitrophus noduliformans]NKE70342.1 ketoacyl-ACP synthase III [Candidatus Manganitrophus noduliformans]
MKAKKPAGKSQIRTEIIGTGSYVPETRMTNKDLEGKIETTDAWIVERTGIRERRIASKDEAASDLAFQAARKALEAAQAAPEEIDLIVLATSTPDMFFPSTACIVQDKLKATRAAAFDLSAACSGFVYALAVGEQYIRSGTYQKVLVIGTEIMSRLINWTDRTTCVIFGDGAGAVLLAPSSSESGILSTHLHSDGSLWDLICVPGGGSAIPPSEKMLAEQLNTIKMKGNETFKVAVRSLEEVAWEALRANDFLPSDVSFLVPHQANLRIIRAVADRLQLPMERVVINLDRYGNTSAASIPLALDEAVREGRIKKGDMLLFLAFGGGLTWGASLVRW